MNLLRPARMKIAVSAIVLLAVIAPGCMPTGLAQESFDLVNAERTSRGIPALSWDQDAANKAQEWAEYMASRRAIGHSNVASGIHGSWTHLGENVGFASTVSRSHNGFMNSTSHRNAILARKYSSVGIGVAVSGGVVYVAQVFRG